LTFLGALATTAKRLYDLAATYLLAYVLGFAVVAYALHLGADGLGSLLGYGSADRLWRSLAAHTPLGPVGLRIVVFFPLHVVLFGLLRRPRRFARTWFEHAFDGLGERLGRWTRSTPRLRLVGGLTYSAAVTAMFVPFVLQPTLVPGYLRVAPWFERSANLLDGTASEAVVESVVGFYRGFVVDPLPAPPVATVSAAPSGAARAPLVSDGTTPFMDRWDPAIQEAAGGDRKTYAFIKAFMWVESAGHQYAVSPTGCAGLMQFSSGTARDRPYRQVFGVGQVYRCDCRGRCSVDPAVQHDLETGDLETLLSHRSEFPCELTDARFDPHKSIEAGALYVDRLREAHGDNLLMMYIGYNSGPAVSNRVWERAGRDPTATLDEIAPHLEAAMLPYYGSASSARAHSLLTNTLPKLARAYDLYVAPQDS